MSERIAIYQELIRRGATDQLNDEQLTELKQLVTDGQVKAPASFHQSIYQDEVNQDAGIIEGIGRSMSKTGQAIKQIGLDVFGSDNAEAYRQKNAQDTKIWNEQAPLSAQVAEVGTDIGQFIAPMAGVAKGAQALNMGWKSMLPAMGATAAAEDAFMQTGEGANEFDKARMALAGAFGVGGEMVAPWVAKGWNKLKGLKGGDVQKGAEIARNLGLNPSDFNNGQLIQFAKDAQQLADNVSDAAKAGRAEFDLHYTKGEQTGDYGQIALEQQARSNTGDAGEIMRQSDQIRDQKINEAIEAFQEQLGQGQRRVGTNYNDAGDVILDDATRQSRLLDEQIDEAYDLMREQGGKLKPEALEDLPQRARNAVEQADIIADKQTPGTLGAFKHIDEKVDEFYPLDARNQPTTDYRMSHTAPMREGRNTLDDMSDAYPDDIYDPSVAGRYYGHGDDVMDDKAARVISRYRGQPDADVPIYRAVPEDVDSIQAGDWITLTERYAKQHGDSVMDGKYKVIRANAKAKDIATDGNSIHEFGYDPVELANMVTKELKDVDINKIESIRRNINSQIGKAKNPTDKKAATLVKREFDAWLDDAVDNALFEGDLDALKKARSLRAEKGRRFQSSGKKDDGGKFMEKVLDEGRTPEEIMNYLTGASKMQLSGSGGSRLVSHMKEALGENSDAVLALKEAAFVKIVRGKKTDGMIGALEKALTGQKSFLKELYSPEELSKISRFKQALDVYGKDMTLKGASGTGQRIQQMLEGFGRTVPWLTGNPLIGLGAEGATAVGKMAGKKRVQRWTQPLLKRQEAPLIPAIGAGTAPLVAEDQ